jgi:GT2 family glycosyltransferase
MVVTPRPSVIVRSKDEANRLRLTLASLAQQTDAAEVVVVNDGSVDHTEAVLAEARSSLDLIPVRNATAQGRSRAANIGAQHARGDILIFLDGDTLAAPNLVRSHVEAHQAGQRRIVRGETYHLRCTRFFDDPATGAARHGEEARVAKMGSGEIARSLVTVDQIRSDFGRIDGRAQPGIYPGAGPRRLFEMEMEALWAQAVPDILWVAASGSNQSVPRDDFLKSGGFHPDISINEHRELALRLCTAGLSMWPCAGRTYHLTHRVGWRDPMQDTGWEDLFFDRHPIPEVALLSVFWDSLNEQSALPPEARIPTLADLANAADRCRGAQGREMIRTRHLKRSATDAAGRDRQP